MYHTPPLGGTDGEPEPREKHECPIGNPDSQHSEVIQKLLQEVWDASAKAERERIGNWLNKTIKIEDLAILKNRPHLVKLTNGIIALRKGQALRRNDG